MISIVEYSYSTAHSKPVDGLDIIREAPINNCLVLSDLICSCVQSFTSIPDIVFVAHSLPFIQGTMDNTLTSVFNAPVIYVGGVPCASTHLAMKMAVQQIKHGRHKRVLVIGCDKAYSDAERRFFGTIMGDAAVGMMIEAGSGLFEILSIRLDTILFAPEGENTAPHLIQKYRDTLPLFLRDCFRKSLSLSRLDSVDYIAPHTATRFVWDVLAKLIDFDRKRILDEDIVKTGHLNSNDSFYHFITHCERGVIKPGESTMLINPGFGGTRGFTILRRS